MWRVGPCSVSSNSRFRRFARGFQEEAALVERVRTLVLSSNKECADPLPVGVTRWVLRPSHSFDKTLQPYTPKVTGGPEPRGIVRQWTPFGRVRPIDPARL